MIKWKSHGIDYHVARDINGVIIGTVAMHSHCWSARSQLSTEDEGQVIRKFFWFNGWLSNSYWRYHAWKKGRGLEKAMKWVEEKHAELEKRGRL